jgi:hypothetical protein
MKVTVNTRFVGVSGRGGQLLYTCSRCDGNLTGPEIRDSYVWVDDSNDIEGGRMEASLELMAQTHICDPEQVASELFKARSSLAGLIEVHLPRWSEKLEWADSSGRKNLARLYERKVESIRETIGRRRAKIEELG